MPWISFTRFCLPQTSVHHYIKTLSHCINALYFVHSVLVCLKVQFSSGLYNILLHYINALYITSGLYNSLLHYINALYITSGLCNILLHYINALYITSGLCYNILFHYINQFNALYFVHSVQYVSKFSEMHTHLLWNISRVAYYTTTLPTYSGAGDRRKIQGAGVRLNG